MSASTAEGFTGRFPRLEHVGSLLPEERDDAIDPGRSAFEALDVPARDPQHRPYASPLETLVTGGSPDRRPRRHRFR